jgi:hypothetical protein
VRLAHGSVVRLAYDALATGFFRHQASFVSELPVVIAVRREMIRSREMIRIGDENRVTTR